MDHNNCRENLSAYLDGELPQGERLALETHLAGCADCRAELVGLKKVSGLMKTHAMEPVPPALKGAVLKEKPRASSPWFKPALAFATAAATLLVVFNLTKTDEDRNYTPGFGDRSGSALYETGFSAREAAPAAEKDMSANESTPPQAQAPTRAPAGAEAGGSAAAAGLYPAENKKAAVAAARGSYAQAKFASPESYGAMFPSAPRPKADGRGEVRTGGGNTVNVSCSALNAGKAPAEAQLTPLMQEFLYRFSPDFKLRPLQEYSAKVLEHYCYSPGSSPSAVIGDFNGDGNPDAHVTGYEPGWLATILLISNGPDAYYAVYAGRQKYEGLEAAVKSCSWCFDKEKKLVHAYYLQPRGASYSCGGDYQIKRTLSNDAVALLETWKNGLYVNYVSIWDDIGKRYVEQHCVLNPCDGSDCP